MKYMNYVSCIKGLPWVYLQFVIVVFHDHIHLLFLISQKPLNHIIYRYLTWSKVLVSLWLFWPVICHLSDHCLSFHIFQNPQHWDIQLLKCSILISKILTMVAILICFSNKIFWTIFWKFYCLLKPVFTNWQQQEQMIAFLLITRNQTFLMKI